MENITPMNDSILYKETFEVDQPNKKIKHFVITIYQPQPPFKGLSMTISSEADHFFLFQLTMSEEDYKAFKAEHMLRPDFESFPFELVRLLEKARKQNEQLYFAFDIEPTRIKLKIKQNTEIRPITILILHFNVASDEEVKQNAKKIIDLLSTSITSLNKNLYNLREEIKFKDTEISRLYDEGKEKEEVMQQQAVSQNMSYQKNLIDIEHKFRIDLEDRLKRQDVENQNQIKMMNSTIQKLETENNLINIKNQSLEKEIIQIQKEIESKSQQQVEEAMKTINILRYKLRLREEELNKQKNEHGCMADQIKELQQTLLTKKASEEKLKQIYCDNQHTIKMVSQDNLELIQKNEALRKQLQHFQLQFNSKSKDLEKSNGIIGSYVKEIENLKYNNNKLAKVIKKLNTEISKNHAQTEESATKWKNLEKQLEEKNQQLEDMKEQHLSSQKCISSLYKRILKLEQGDRELPEEASPRNDNVEDYYYKKFFKDSDGAILAHSSPTEKPKVTCKK